MFYITGSQKIYLVQPLSRIYFVPFTPKEEANLESRREWMEDKKTQCRREDEENSQDNSKKDHSYVAGLADNQLL